MKYLAVLVGAQTAKPLTERSVNEDAITSIIILIKYCVCMMLSVRLACKDMTALMPTKDDEDDTAEELCNCQFTLAYGTKILLHNTSMRLKRGAKYGLLGGNESGKTTLMRAIANGSVEVGRVFTLYIKDQ